MKINLNDIINAIERQGDLVSYYYHKDSGSIISIEDPSISKYTASDVEDFDKFEEWERDLIANLFDFEENPQDYIPLPNKIETIREAENMLAKKWCEENEIKYYN